MQEEKLETMQQAARDSFKQFDKKAFMERCHKLFINNSGFQKDDS
jgi:hypothetical protein